MDINNFDKPIGGTELMYNELMSRLPDSYKERFSIFNYPQYADFSKKTIYWNQLSYDQNIVNNFFNSPENYIDKVDHFVFVSNWQAEMFRKIYGIPGYKTHVIKNACADINQRQGLGKKVRLCYTSTPWRGLDVLLNAWELLNPTNCELHVFSSCQIYGSEFAKENEPLYQELYDKCQKLPGVVYRGSIPNDELRKELSSFDILAYPCTFEETSCIAVIEALSAGLKVVTSSLGALPETTEGWATIYPYLHNPDLHARKFAKVLSEQIEWMERGYLAQNLNSQRLIYYNRWNWDSRIIEWTDFLTETLLKEKSFSVRTLWEKQIFKECYVENEYQIEKFDINDVVIDLGTHIGSFSLLAHEKGSRNILTFEAEKSNYEMAISNLPYLGIKLYNKAVWRSDEDRETVTFDRNIVDFNTGMGRVVAEQGEPVECIKFDDILDPYKRVRFVKIDIEGAEYAVLYTSKQLKKVKELVGEFHEYGDSDINGYACDRNGLKRFLEDNGFVVTIKQAHWSDTCGFFRAYNNI